MMKKSKKNLGYETPHENVDFTPTPIFYTDGKYNYETISAEPDEVKTFEKEYPSVLSVFLEEHRRKLIEFIRVYRKNHSK